MWMVWSRESAAVFFASPARTSGRMPAKTLRMSARARRAGQIEARRVEDEVDLGLDRAGLEARDLESGESVVPTSVWPCQGIANMTRPSLVCGTMIALSPGRNERSKTR